MIPGLKEYVEFFVDDQMIAPTARLPNTASLPLRTPSARKSARPSRQATCSDHDRLRRCAAPEPQFFRICRGLRQACRGDVPMSTSLLLLIIALIGFIAFLAGRARSFARSGGKLASLHSLPGYHGSYVAIWAMLPALLLLAVMARRSSDLCRLHRSLRLFQNRLAEPGGSHRSARAGSGQVRGRGLRTPECGRDRCNRERLDQHAGSPGAKGVALAGEGEPYMIQSAQQFNAMRQYSRWLMSAVVLLGFRCRRALRHPQYRRPFPCPQSGWSASCSARSSSPLP